LTLEKKAASMADLSFRSASHHAGLPSGLEQKDTTQFNLGMHCHVPSLLWSNKQILVSSPAMEVV
jgi:hypothetical protein